MKLSTLVFIFTFSPVCFCQTVPVNIPGLLELNDMVMVNDKLYAGGCNTTQRTVPVLTCINLKGDTIWYREFPQLCDLGRFNRIIHFKDTLYAVGSGSKGDYGQDKSSFLVKISMDAKVTDVRSMANSNITCITHDDKYVWITGEQLSYKTKGMVLMKFDGAFNNSKGKIFTSTADRKGKYAGNCILAQDTTIWVGSTCDYTHQEIYNGKTYHVDKETFTVTRFSPSLDSISTSYPIAPNRGECNVMLEDHSHHIWTAGKAKKSKDSLGFAVACYRTSGEKLFSAYHSLSDHADHVQDIIETNNGDIMIFSSSDNTPEIHVYRDQQFYRKIILDPYTDHKIQKVIEYKPNQFIFLCLQLVGAFYGRSAMIHWKFQE